MILVNIWLKKKSQYLILRKKREPMLDLRVKGQQVELPLQCQLPM